MCVNAKKKISASNRVLFLRIDVSLLFFEKKKTFQDGSSALKISLEAGYRDIGVLLYAHEYMTKNKSPYTSLRRSGRRKQSTTSLSSSTTALASGSGATAAVAGNSSATTSLHHSSLGIATSPTGRPNQR